MKDRKKTEKILSAELPEFEYMSDVILLDYDDEDSEKVRYQNMMTGKSSYVLDDVLRDDMHNLFFQSNDSRYKMNGIYNYSNVVKGFYIHYDKKNKAIVLYTGEFNINSPIEGEIRSWENMKTMYAFGRNGEIYSIWNRFFFGDNINDYVDMTSESTIFGDVKCEIDVVMFHNYTKNLLKDFFDNSASKSRMGYVTQKRMIETCSGICVLYNVFMTMTEKNTYISEHMTAEEEKLLSYKLPEPDKSRFLPLFDKEAHLEAIREIGSTVPENIDLTKFYQNFDVLTSIVQNIKEGLSVIRIFAVCAKVDDIYDHELTAEDLEIYEDTRIYVTDKRVYYFAHLMYNWFPFADGVKFRYIDSNILLPYTEEDANGTLLSYVKGIYDKHFKNILDNKEYVNYNGKYIYEPSSSEYRRFFEALECPYVKSIFSSPFENIKECIVGLMKSKTINDAITCCFPLQTGWNKEYDVDIAKQIPCKPHMLYTFDAMLGKYKDVCKEDYLVVTGALKTINVFFSDAPEYLDNMNKEQYQKIMETYIEYAMYRGKFEEKYGYLDKQGKQEYRRMYLNILAKHISVHGDFEDKKFCIKNLVKLFGPKNILSYIKYIYKTTTKSDFIDIENNEFYVLQNYYDAINMLALMEQKPEKMEWKFKTKEQMINAHTEITYLFNIETNREFDERAMERFNVVKKNWKGLEYKTDNFCVIPPKKPSEIVMEGIVLNHCVSSYVELVLNGETNIFFVRRSSDIEKPFYTLEIRHNKVRQCHGFDDCNIDEVEGLEEFLKDYCKEKNIKYDCPDAVL